MAARKRGNAPKVTRQRGVSIAGQETVVARLTRERDETLLRETANAEIFSTMPQLEQCPMSLPDFASS
ncbi:MAG: hypothetical protein WBG18_20305 [Xanthobacteraceae bacterium]